MKLAWCFHLFLGRPPYSTEQKGKDGDAQRREQTSKQKQRVTRQTERVHHPDRLAAALAVMPANNSRITLQILLNRCKHSARQRERQRLTIVLSPLNGGISSSSSSLF